MAEGDLFNEWLKRTLPEIRETIPDAALTATYTENDTYDILVESKGYHPILLTIVRRGRYFNVRNAVVVVGKDGDSASITIPMAKTKSITAVLRNARKAQEEPDAEPK